MLAKITGWLENEAETEMPVHPRYAMEMENQGVTEKTNAAIKATVMPRMLKLTLVLATSAKAAATS